MSETAPVTTDNAPATPATTDTTTKVETPVAPSLRDLFLSKVPEEERKSWETFKDDDSLVKTFVAQKHLVGKKGDIPKEDAPPEAYKEFWGKLGADKIDLKAPELGAEFGDLAGQLKETYGKIGQQLAEIAKSEVLNSKNVPDLMNRIFAKFVAQDAAEAKQAQVEAQKAETEMIQKTAVKAGLTPEQLLATNKEVMSRFGWNEQTPVHEVLYHMAKMTSNSNTLADAALNNTSQGLQAQIDEVSSSDEYLRMTGPKHDAAVAKMHKLLERQFAIMQKTA